MSGTGIEKNTELTEVSGTGIERIPNLLKCRVPVSNKYRTYRVPVLRPYRTNTGRPGNAVEGIPVPGVYLIERTDLTDLSGIGIENVPYLPKCWVAVLKIYRTSKCRVPVFEPVSNLPKCRIPVLRPYRTNTGRPGILVEGVPIPGVYLGERTDLNEVSSTGIETVLNLPKCRVAV